jgi:hypothetical protein
MATEGVVLMGGLGVVANISGGADLLSKPCRAGFGTCLLASACIPAVESDDCLELGRELAGDVETELAAEEQWKPEVGKGNSK